MNGSEQAASQAAAQPVDVRAVIRDALNEFISMERAKAEPAYKAELVEERKKREVLETRLNEMLEENRRARALAEEAERSSCVRTELQRLGVKNLDLAYRAVKDDIVRSDDGRLVARSTEGEIAFRPYLESFVSNNPELLPPRISGGSGMNPQQRPASGPAIDLDRIKPGMNPEELARVREEIARVASQTSGNL